MLPKIDSSSRDQEMALLFILFEPVDSLFSRLWVLGTELRSLWNSLMKWVVFFRPFYKPRIWGLEKWQLTQGHTAVKWRNQGWTLKYICNHLSCLAPHGTFAVGMLHRWANVHQKWLSIFISKLFMWNYVCACVSVPEQIWGKMWGSPDSLKCCFKDKGLEKVESQSRKK